VLFRVNSELVSDECNVHTPVCTSDNLLLLCFIVEYSICGGTSLNSLIRKASRWTAIAPCAGKKVLLGTAILVLLGFPSHLHSTSSSIFNSLPCVAHSPLRLFSSPYPITTANTTIKAISDPPQSSPSYNHNQPQPAPVVSSSEIYRTVQENVCATSNRPFGLSQRSLSCYHSFLSNHYSTQHPLSNLRCTIQQYPTSSIASLSASETAFAQTTKLK